VMSFITGCRGPAEGRCWCASPPAPVNPSDLALLRGSVHTSASPLILGHEGSGTVIATGPGWLARAAPQACRGSRPSGLGRHVGRVRRCARCPVPATARNDRGVGGSKAFQPVSGSSAMAPCSSSSAMLRSTTLQNTLVHSRRDDLRCWIQREQAKIYPPRLCIYLAI
jgi:alcohol dehydrogenase-like protein